MQDEAAEDTQPAETPEVIAAPEVSPDVVQESAPVLERVSATRTRRAPRFGAFVFVAVFLAALLAGLLSFVRDSFLPPEALAGRALDSWGMFWLLLLSIGALLALASFGVAVWLDRRSVRGTYGAQALKEPERRSFREIRRERKAAEKARLDQARARAAAAKGENSSD